VVFRLSITCQDNEAGVAIATPINPLVDGVLGYVSYQRIVDSAAQAIYGLSAFIFQVGDISTLQSVFKLQCVYRLIAGSPVLARKSP
jgi:hypothetical protein